MNCRANEEKVFPSETVKPVLEKHFVEARLHTDGDRGKELRQLQQEMVRSVANPYYIVIDPVSGQRVGGELMALTTEDTFREFLKDAVEAHEKVSRLEE